MDKGFHTHGKYKQLHLHGIIFATHRLLETWINGFRIYYSDINYYYHPLIRQRLHNYIHSDDWDSMYKLEQLLIENDYYYLAPTKEVRLLA